MNAHPALGLDLGTRTVTYTEQDAILYALAVGAPAAELDLVFERDLRVLPTYSLALGRWGMEELRRRGHFDGAQALHGAQTLRVLAPLPTSGGIEISAEVTAVWDKGGAALFEVTTRSAYFEAVSTVFAHHRGGWGGERGPASRRTPETAPALTRTFATSPDQPALYRLTGDPHLIHIDPEAARAIGAPRPILHGLCTLGFATREIADALGVRPHALAGLQVRFSRMALPGEELTVRLWDEEDGGRPFAVSSTEGEVLSGGLISFGAEAAA
ncbi:MaoC family dehydratase N-terminal domain-containing protein [Nocardioides sp. LMS-CY]|uniref:MaoC/PaaZ C-terminal domain-containing protein n=1 Tax=Nocardioides sp. (strain LMS-CY) TaxID=2840457 RepID=UPI001C004FEA|nr:MaoC/PaaZ C-terminal domain-containing protein [Nocardioides sp. LMS-CY]QWF23232.1 MaoC family dehydratase N-terminal domain-containing protein [Nocardioides sp. LMS-CY]